jgi:opacity protein-like surface antigen
MLTNARCANLLLSTLRRLAAVLSVAILTATPVSAQTESGGLASVTVSAIPINSETKASFAAAVAYRFNRTAALGVELTVLPSFTPLTSEYPLTEATRLTYPSPIVRYEPIGGHITLFTGNLRLAVPTRWTRVSPYMIGGAGVGTSRAEIDSVVDYGPIILPNIPGSLPRTIVSPIIRERITRATTDVAVTIGGGISVMMADHWSVDADARYFGVAGQASADLGRFGGGLTYRF